MRTTRLAIIGLICLLVGIRANATAQPLVDRIPADALIYFGWSGAESLGPVYPQSHLKSVLDASEIPQLMQNLLPAMSEKFGRKDANVAQVLQQISAIGGPLWRHPTAFYFGGLDFSTGAPMPRIALICDAGADADSLLAQEKNLAAKAPSDAPPITAQKYGSLVVAAMGSPDMVDSLFARAPLHALGDAPAFTSAVAQVQSDSVIVGYIDVAGIVKAVDDVMTRANDPDVSSKWTRLRDSLDLPGVHQMIWSTGFDGKDWGTTAFVGTNGGKAGLPGMFAGKPLDNALLSAVPQSANRVFATEFDLGGLVRAIRSGMDQFNPNVAEQFDDLLTRVNTVLGLDVQKDLLDSLGNQWVLYTDRSVGGPGLLGTVVVNRPRDLARTDAALQQLASRGNRAIAKAMNQPEVTVEFREQIIDGLTVHYLAVPFVSPAWAVKDGNLYVALYPQVIAAAAEQASARRPSILQSQEYVALQKRLGNHNPTSVTYLDLPATAGDGYEDMLALTQLYLGMADVLGLHVPAMVLPPLNKITPHLSPSGGISWSDENGWHYRDITPFPGANALAGGTGSAATIGETSMMISILLPSLNRARETANRVKCASNERQIGLAILLYCNENKGNYPPDLGTLVKTEDITPQVFVCPSGETTVPPGIGTMTPDQQAAWVNEHSDYVYVGKGLTSSAQPDKVVLYEKEGAHGGDGMNFLYGDGHVEFQNTAGATREIERATKP